MLALFVGEASVSSKHTNFRFWQSGNHAIELYSEKFVWDKINYIHHNPVKAGFVTKPEDWRFSSASNYLGVESVLDEVCCVSRVLQDD